MVAALRQVSFMSQLPAYGHFALLVIGGAAVLGKVWSLLNWATATRVDPACPVCQVCPETSSSGGLWYFVAGVLVLPAAELVVALRREWAVRLSRFGRIQRPSSLPKLRA